MQLTSRHWVIQKPFPASKEHWKISRTRKQRPDKAQKPNIVVEINIKKKEPSEDFQHALNAAIFVSSLLISSHFFYDFMCNTAATS